MDPWNGFKRNKCKNSEEKEMEGEKKTIKKSYCERFFPHSGMESNQTAQLYILYDQS